MHPILSHLFAFIAGAIFVCLLIHLILTLWVIPCIDAGDGGEDGGDTPSPQPTNPDPTPSKCKPLPSPSTATSSSSPAPVAPPAASAPAATARTPAPLPTSVRLPGKPPASSATPASSAPAPAVPDPAIRVVLLDGPLDGLELRVATTARPLTVQTLHGLHRYIPTDRHDLNRPIYLHTGPAPL